MSEALPGTPFEIGIIRSAGPYIPTLLKDRDLRQKYENALKIQRGGSEGDNVVVLLCVARNEHPRQERMASASLSVALRVSPRGLHSNHGRDGVFRPKKRRLRAVKV